MQENNLGKNTTSNVVEEQPVDKDRGGEETKEQAPDQDQDVGQGPDSGLERSRRLEQRHRRNYSDMTFGNGADIFSKNVLVSSISTGTEEAFCMMRIVGETSKGTQKAQHGNEPPEGQETDRWRESMAKKLKAMWDNEASREGSTPKGALPVDTSFVFRIKRSADDGIER